MTQFTDIQACERRVIYISLSIGPAIAVLVEPTAALLLRQWLYGIYVLCMFLHLMIWSARCKNIDPQSHMVPESSECQHSGNKIFLPETILGNNNNYNS